MNRQQVIDEIGKCVLQDRNADYGTPEDNFADTAAIWTIYLRRRGLLTKGQALTSKDVAALMVGLKMARLGASPNKLDNWVDLGGYAVCGGEVAAFETARDAALSRKIVFKDD